VGRNPNPGKDPTSAYDIKPHTDLYTPVDGVAAPHLQKNAVYKVATGTTITVTNTSIDHSSPNTRAAVANNIVPGYGWINGTNTATNSTNGFFNHHSDWIALLNKSK
jgi:hypothetical protein